MKRLDIFGGEVDIDEVFKVDKKPNVSYKKAFREEHGYNHFKNCGKCKNFVSCTLATTIVYRCKKIGMKTSISAGDYACDLYEEEIC